MGKHVIVVGVQWGDESKGRVVDFLTLFYDAVIRFQGGDNAGHTVVDDSGRTFKMRQIPSGVVRGVLAVLGNGMVPNPFALVEEIEELRKAGLAISPENLIIAESAPLNLPIHSELDRIREEMSGKNKIGTTGRGIGPAYEDKIARRAIRVADLSDPAYLKDRLAALFTHHNALRRGLGAPEASFREAFVQLREIAPKILLYAAPVWQVLYQMDQKGKRFIFEGAQGAMLSVEHGTYPYVTSSDTSAGQAAVGSGFPAGKGSFVLGVAKAYTTRVGGGPFPTELSDETGSRMRERGNEFGTNTGRPRRCGWFDAVAVRQAVRLSGVDGLVISKLDVLDGFSELKICVDYRDGGKSYDYLPASPAIQATCEPVYESLPGWEDPCKGATSVDRLPAAAINYLRRIEKFVGVPVILASASPVRGEMVVVTDHEILHGRVTGCTSRFGHPLAGI